MRWPLNRGQLFVWKGDVFTVRGHLLREEVALCKTKLAAAPEYSFDLGP